MPFARYRRVVEFILKCTSIIIKQTKKKKEMLVLVLDMFSYEQTVTHERSQHNFLKNLPRKIPFPSSPFPTPLFFPGQTVNLLTFGLGMSK
jgi:hypothetical protein